MVSIIISMMAISVAVFLVMAMVGEKGQTDSQKTSPFECGFNTYQEGRHAVVAHFFGVALVFLIFDMELVLLFPFLSNLLCYFELTGLTFVLVFLMLLMTGLFIEWEKSMLEWRT